MPIPSMIDPTWMATYSSARIEPVKPGLEQIGVDAVDVLGGVEPRQVVA